MGTDAYKIAPHQLPAPRFHEKIQFPAQEQKDLIAVMAVKIRGLNGGKLDVFILTGKILVQMQKYFFSPARPWLIPPVLPPQAALYSSRNPRVPVGLPSAILHHIGPGRQRERIPVCRGIGTKGFFLQGFGFLLYRL